MVFKRSKGERMVASRLWNGGRVDQPTAEDALRRLEPLVGEWSLEASGPDGLRLPGDGRATIEWHDSGVHLIERSTVDTPEAPGGDGGNSAPPSSGNAVSIMGCDAANDTYVRLHADERGICCIYQMSIEEREWKLWREGEPFPQRFTATISEDGNTITGRWVHRTPDGQWETDINLVYRRVT